ncbi:ABC transporter permease subunit [Spirochaeta isovalerica]|uniref:ABC-type dipeptide/oligopeptide/nickel transport system permease component n=1 Tax=Spirochaeta isovalerica TaxID=150 RepID=A0A841RBY5_9SPIO|nr:ABC transporter permease subunit [Spirochaeta isovalerica]MBB6480520.1 ABC-type dipeptide/oligopeptide/nickel transport system permease component [Spirochaeta isovalerica]
MKLIKFVWAVLLTLAVLTVLVILPTVLVPTEEGLRLDFMSVRRQFIVLGNSLVSGDFFIYRSGRYMRNLLESLPAYTYTTFYYALFGSIVSLFLGLFMGMFLLRSNKARLIETAGFISLVPDFMIATILQLLVIKLTGLTGLNLVRIASTGSDRKAILLPIITMAVTAGFYLTRSIYSHSYKELGEDFVLFAKAKGIDRRNIYIRHIFPSVVKNLRSDLKKYLTLIISNLFIIERIFNIPGISRLFFTFAYSVGWQYTGAAGKGRFTALISTQINVALISLIALIAVYFTVYWILYGILRILLKAASGE